MSEGTQRRLAAIVSADVVGYSRLMGQDEAGTHRRLKARYLDLVAPGIDRHGGRVVKLMGDGLLAEFASVVDAVSWSVEVQNEVTNLDTEVPEEQRVRYRIGVNLGDIIADEDDIFGDGVNVAARLQEIAAPGGIAISDIVQGQIDGRLDAQFEDAGRIEMKNISRPVRVWLWSPQEQDVRPATPADDAASEPPLPDKPSIAVLPFDNMSGDPEQEYFADGITEDIITELSRYRGLWVIARNSTFVYKGISVPIQRVGRELGVAYVLEGSIRKGGNRIRITAQLIDAEGGEHLWAERFDRSLDDIFAVQDEITQVVAGTIGPKLEEVRAERIKNEDPARLNAYDLVLRSHAHWNRFTKEDHEEAGRLAQAAIDIDPTFSRGYSALAGNLVQSRNSGYLDDLDGSLNDGLIAAQKAVSLDEQDAQAHTTFSILCLFAERHDQAISESRRAIELNPNHARARAYLANALGLAGETEEALIELDTAMRLNPHYPSNYLMILGRIHFVNGDYSAAIAPLERAINISPGYTPSQTVLAACYWAVGREQEAESKVRELLAKFPKLNKAFVRTVTPIKDIKIRERFADYLGKAGLPE
jgi:TolB-like protein/Flp pilus assembly protein TadD